MQTEHAYINEKEVSKITGRALSTLRNDRHAGRGLPYIKWGSRFVRYNKSDVFKFMENMKIKTKDF